ncbi:hypothetical protein BDW75DRAFT_227979 [Aspergillus navahoensis]
MTPNPAYQHNHLRPYRSSTSRDEQIRYQNLFVWELARHVVGEEIVVYPALEKHVQNLGAGLATKDREKHQAVMKRPFHHDTSTPADSHCKKQLKSFQALDPSNPTFVPTLQGLMNDLWSHMREEEGEDLVMLEETLSEQDSQGLSKAFNRTKMFAPSRAHPGAPNKPPFETAVADLFRKWPRKGVEV